MDTAGVASATQLEATLFEALDGAAEVGCRDHEMIEGDDAIGVTGIRACDPRRPARQPVHVRVGQAIHGPGNHALAVGTQDVRDVVDGTHAARH
jgi:hypothetical protein